MAEIEEPRAVDEQSDWGASRATAPDPVAGRDPGEARAPEGHTPEDRSGGEPSGGEPSGGEPSGDADGLKDQIIDALKNVHDPELGVNIVDLGLVYGVDVQGDAVHITYTLTTMGCPIGPMIEAEMQRFLSGVEGLTQVSAEMVFRPACTPEMMSEEAKAALGFF